MAPKQTSMISFTDEEREYARLVSEIVSPIVPGLCRALPPRTEVLLHDLTNFPNSIVAIAGNLTGRSVGGPPTDLGMEVLATGVVEDMIGYRTKLDNGEVLKSSSVFFRVPSTGRAVAALCMNTDVEDAMRAQEILAAIAFPLRRQGEVVERDAPHETFPSSVDVLAQGILRDAIGASGVSVDLMKKRHKLDVVRELNRRGFFTLRESVDIAAKGLSVSRYTIYNYLNEIEAEDGPDEPSQDGLATA